MPLKVSMAKLLLAHLNQLRSSLLLPQIRQGTKWRLSHTSHADSEDLSVTSPSASDIRPWMFMEVVGTVPMAGAFSSTT